MKNLDQFFMQHMYILNVIQPQEKTGFLVPEYLCCFASVFLFCEPEQCYYIHNISRLRETHVVKGLQKLEPTPVIIIYFSCAKLNHYAFFYHLSKTLIIWELPM